MRSEERGSVALFICARSGRGTDLALAGMWTNYSARWSSSELVAFLCCDGKQDAGSSWMLIVGFMELISSSMYFRETDVLCLAR